MYCGKCGANIADKSVFCTECGSRISSSDNIDKTDNHNISTIDKHISKAPELQKTRVLKKLICSDCGAKNNPLNMTCIQCGSNIDKSKLNIVCPICKSIMSIDYGICPVCKWDIEHARWSSFEAQYEWNGGNNTDSPILFSTNNNSYSANPTYKSSSKTGIIIGLSIAVFLVAIFLFYIYKTENQQAMDLYNIAYSNLYNTDVTYISNTTKNMIDNAVDQSESIFVSERTKEKISQLKQDGIDYKRLEEIENLLTNNAGRNIETIKEEINSISSQNVKSDERYTNILPYMKATEFKMDNKTWADKTLNELKSEHADTIQSWSRNHNIHYYTGSVYFISADKEGMDISLEDYEGNTHYLSIYYNYDESSDWDEHIGKIRRLLEDETPCVMAVITAENYADSDQIISYSYIKK